MQVQARRGVDVITNRGKRREGKGDTLSLIKYSSDRAVRRYPHACAGCSDRQFHEVENPSESGFQIITVPYDDSVTYACTFWSCLKQSNHVGRVWKFVLIVS
jgi:hypothetical protein